MIYDDFPVEVCVDPISKTAPLVDDGVLVEVGEDTLYVYWEGLPSDPPPDLPFDGDERDAICDVLERVVEALRG